MTTLAKPQAIDLEGYPSLKTESVRYRDTDRQGHVNNALFATYLECARTGLLYDPDRQLLAPGCEYVIARLEIAFLKEMTWPGGVIIGTRVGDIGRSSVLFEQALFQDGSCTATATSVMVMIDAASRRSVELSPGAIAEFERLAA